MAITYPGFAYRQTDDAEAPWLVLVVVPAEELLLWAGIPRRTETSTMGFQRVDDDVRVRRTKDFFNLPPNQSPTALIVGVHRPMGRKPLVTLNLSGESGEAVRACTLTVDFDPATLTLESAIEMVKGQLAARLGSVMETEPSPDTDDAVLDRDSEDQDAPEEDEAADTGIELSHSLLRRVASQMDDAAWVTENAASIMDMAKPATIIDGQHRVLGAALCERRIPFAVCVMMNCSWPEQVFQFTVVNYSAKGIPDQFITANAALSLTQTELDDLQGRLTQARVKVVEYELMKVVQFDPESAFYEMINLSEGRDDSKIGYKTMVRVAREWYNASHPVLKNTLLPALMPSTPGRSGQSKRLDIWKEDLWGKFFTDFWRVVRDTYQSHNYKVNSDDESQPPTVASLWSVGSQLLVAIVLYELQRQWFQALHGLEEEYFAVPPGEDPVSYLRSRLRAFAVKFVTWYPPAFFAKEWGMKSLNISSGRKSLQTALSKFREHKGRYQYGKSVLVTGETG